MHAQPTNAVIIAFVLGMVVATGSCYAIGTINLRRIEEAGRRAAEKRAQWEKLDPKVRAGVEEALDGHQG